MARCVFCSEIIERVSEQPALVDLSGLIEKSAPWSSDADGTRCPDAKNHQHVPMTKQDYAASLFDKEI